MEYKEFVNPYHFAPLAEQSPQREAAPWNEKSQGAHYTGRLKVKLRTRTPLFIPDIREIERKKEQEHKTYSFFSYDGKTPVIPGSSLRGMLRGIYETVTNSCLSVVDLEEKPIRRTSDAYSPGLLMWNSGRLFLIPARKAIVNGHTREMQKDQARDPMEWGEGQKVWVKTRDGERPGPHGKKLPTEFVTLISEKQQKVSSGEGGWSEGWYFKGEAGVMKWRDGRKETGYVFLGGGGSYLLAKKGSDCAEIQELLEVLESYKKNSELKITADDYGGYQEYRENLNRFLEERVSGSRFPVHYSEVGTGKTLRRYLSPAGITKEVSYTPVSSILKAQAEHDTCKSITSLCPACWLFGMVGENAVIPETKYPDAWSSQVRVGDAFPLRQKDWYGAPMVLQELAGPKKSVTEFYLQKPKEKNAASWSYDYYTEYGPTDRDGKLHTYTPEISGRKFYWHHKDGSFPPAGAVEITKRNCTVTPVKSGTEFEFYVYLEQVTRQQLDQLIWICNISRLAKQDEKAKYGYKLGKGKPLGLGSVELFVEDVQIRSLRKNGHLCYHLTSYEEKFQMPYQEIAYHNEASEGNAGFDRSVEQAFWRLCDFGAAGDYLVTYPVSKGQSVTVADEGFKWFQYNRFNLSFDRKSGVKGKGNGKVTKRTELGFEQHFETLTKDSPITLRVNTSKDGWPDETSYGENVTATDRIVKKNAQTGR